MRKPFGFGATLLGLLARCREERVRLGQLEVDDLQFFPRFVQFFVAARNADV